MGFQIAFLSLLLVFSHVSAIDWQTEAPLVKTFHSKPIRLAPGGVYKRIYAPMEMPEGHIALKSLNAEVVDEFGASVPLSEAYLHHWIALPTLVDITTAANLTSYEATADANADVTDASASDISNIYELVRKQKALTMETKSEEGGFCNGGALPAWFGVGAETRRTNVEYPDPFGVEIGNPSSIPEGKKLIWWSEIHVIDTRGASNAKACIECRCDVYNTTVDEKGGPLPEGYTGGLRCCYEGVKCHVADGYVGEERTLYLKYAVKWVPMNPCVVPLKTFLYDVTDCKIEYDVPGCTEEGGQLADCVHTKQLGVHLPISGRIVQAVGHLHVGARGISMKRQDGSLVCESLPIYGLGDEPGDESGYVTGMRSCKFSSNLGPRIAANETITIRSTYSQLGGGHTGVMGFFFLAIDPEENYVNVNSNCGYREDLLLSALDKSVAEVRNSESWRVSMVGAFGGFLVGIVVTAVIAATVILFLKNENSAVSYSPLSST